jgi:two-component system chemotaxis sensor kinase CheA
MNLNWLGQFAEQERADALPAMGRRAGSRCCCFAISPTRNASFRAKTRFTRSGKFLDLALLDLAPTEPWPPLAELDAYRCVLRFEGVACAPRADVATLFRYVPDQICLLEAPPHVLAVPVGRRDDTRPHEGFVAEALELVGQEDWAGLRGIAAAILDPLDPADWVASALRWLARLLDGATPDLAAVRLLLEAIRTEQAGRIGWPVWRTDAPATTAAATTGPRALSDAEQAAFQRIATEQLRILELPVEPESWSGRIRSICACLANGSALCRARCLAGGTGRSARKRSGQWRDSGAVRDTGPAN